MFDRSAAVSRRRLMGLGAGVIGAAAMQVVPGATPVRAEPRPGHYEMPIDDGAIVPRERIGIQLYTLRATVRELGYDKVFRRLAAIGYTQVEFAGYEGEDPTGLSRAGLAELLEEYGLTPAGAHMQGAINDSTIDDHIQQALDLGVPAIGQASLPTTFDQATIDSWNRWGARAAEAGLTFYLHNHSGELQTTDANGKTPYERYIEETDPAAVSFELDVYWAFNATVANPSLDPAQLVIDHADRFVLYHVKDGHEPGSQPPDVSNPFGLVFGGAGYSMTHLGQGDIDYETFFNRIRTADIAAGRPADGRHRGYMLENDNTNGQADTKEAWVTAVTGQAWMAHGLRIAE
ncbi:sugar phosphate isomerase/epimerase [Euzebya pacifica]|uniref:sugar phosphate isomerase/epimerase family protein n=1 Tax=Euzebya pacifica TaxID=1608957 RepID=UPI0030FC600C